MEWGYDYVSRVRFRVIEEVRLPLWSTQKWVAHNPEVRFWIAENMKGRIALSDNRVGFSHKEDAFLFKLRWGGDGVLL
jgi:hypothetical protein